MYVYVYVCLCACVSLCICICMHVCARVCVHVHMHTFLSRENNCFLRLFLVNKFITLHLLPCPDVCICKLHIHIPPCRSESQKRKKGPAGTTGVPTVLRKAYFGSRDSFYFCRRPVVYSLRHGGHTHISRSTHKHRFPIYIYIYIYIYI